MPISTYNKFTNTRIITVRSSTYHKKLNQLPPELRKFISEEVQGDTYFFLLNEVDIVLEGTAVLDQPHNIT